MNDWIYYTQFGEDLSGQNVQVTESIGIISDFAETTVLRTPFGRKKKLFVVGTPNALIAKNLDQHHVIDAHRPLTFLECTYFNQSS